MRQRAALAITVLLLASLLTAARAAYDARPPLAHTGGFGEPTCRQCHFDGPARPAGTVALGGVPERYRPDSIYQLDVAIRDSTAMAGGFQLAARVTEGPHAGKQAGTLCALGPRVTVATDTATGVQYASHAGAASADSLRWQLAWRAPGQDVGSITFHVAANSANDDDSMLGDAILLASSETRPDTARGQGSGVRDQGVSGSRCQEMRASFSFNPVPDPPDR